MVNGTLVAPRNTPLASKCPSLKKSWRHVRSTMEHCSPWMGNTVTELGRLDSVQRSATRLMGVWGKDLPSLSHRRGVAALCSFHRIVHSSALPAEGCTASLPAAHACALSSIPHELLASQFMVLYIRHFDSNGQSSNMIMHILFVGSA